MSDVEDSTPTPKRTSPTTSDDLDVVLEGCSSAMSEESLSEDSTSVPEDSNSHVQAEALHMWDQIGRDWAAYDIWWFLKLLKTFKEQVQPLEYTYKASRWLIPYRSSALENLPNEILMEIFKCMGWREVLSSRQSCRRLFEISTARPLWVFLFQRLSRELLALPILERLITTYTANELEHVVLKRIMSEVAWANGRHPRMRTFSMAHHYMHDNLLSMHDNLLLLEGGRWLLSTSPKRGAGRVYAYDLDELSEEPQCIINFQPDDPQQSWHMAADMDQSGSSLAFNLCLIPVWTPDADVEDVDEEDDSEYSASSTGSTFTPDIEDGSEDDSESSETDPPAEFHVYRLTLTGHGSNAILEAHKLKSLYNGLGISCHAITMRGHYLATKMKTRPHERSFVEIWNWFLSDSSLCLKSCILPHDDDIFIHSVVLLPDAKLLTVSNAGIALYDVANLHTVPSGKIDRDLRLQPYWHHMDPDMCYAAYQYLSKPYSNANATRLTISNPVSCGIYGLFIPHNGDDPWYQPISDIKPIGTHGYLGISKTYDQSLFLRIRTSSHMWPGDEDRVQDGSMLLTSVAQLASHTTRNKLLYYSNPLFDEHTNRIFSLVGRYGFILDFGTK